MAGRKKESVLLMPLFTVLKPSKERAGERKMTVQRLNTLILFSEMYSSQAKIGFNALKLRAAPLFSCVY